MRWYRALPWKRARKRSRQRRRECPSVLALLIAAVAACLQVSVSSLTRKGAVKRWSGRATGAAQVSFEALTSGGRLPQKGEKPRTRMKKTELEYNGEDDDNDQKRSTKAMSTADGQQVNQDTAALTQNMTRVTQANANPAPTHNVPEKSPNSPQGLLATHLHLYTSMPMNVCQ